MRCLCLGASYYNGVPKHIKYSNLPIIRKGNLIYMICRVDTGRMIIARHLHLSIFYRI